MNKEEEKLLKAEFKEISAYAFATACMSTVVAFIVFLSTDSFFNGWFSGLIVSTFFLYFYILG